MKTKLFLDTNVVLDLLGKRDPFFDSIAKIATLADKELITIYVSALSYATVNYFLSKYGNSQLAKKQLRKFKIISEISDLTGLVIEKALNSNFSDFEDALQYYCALHSDCDIIITRNAKDFKESQIPVMTGEEYLRSINKK